MSARDLESLVDDAVEALRIQRRAIAEIDVDALLSSNARTGALLRGLEEAVRRQPAFDPALRQRIEQVSIEAEATGLLVQDALHTIRGAMGLSEAPRVYDASGNMKARARQARARSI